jgi:hypothetical protein
MPLRPRPGLVLAALLTSLAASCGDNPPPSSPAPGPAGPMGSVASAFLVTHVVYATLANASVRYEVGHSFGATVSPARSFAAGLAVQAATDPVILVADAEQEVQAGRAWGSAPADATDVAVRRHTPYTKVATTDQIDHGNDEIWFLLRPAVSLTLAEAGQPAALRWRFAAGAGQTVTGFVYVRELRDPASMRPAVKQLLEQAGVTAAQYPQLLSADPFGGSGSVIDPDRFLPVLRVPFIPRPQPDHTPSTSTWNNPQLPAPPASSRELPFVAEIRPSGEQAFRDRLGSALATPDTFIWTASTPAGTPPAGAAAVPAATIVVGQPEFGYTGRTILSIYFDRLWKSYLFTFDDPP